MLLLSLFTQIFSLMYLSWSGVVRFVFSPFFFIFTLFANSSCHLCVEFEFDDANVTAEEITDKIMALPVADRLWPNCLDRFIKNASMVDVDDFSVKMKKVASKPDGSTSEMAVARGAATRTRSKLSTHVPKPF